MATADVVGVFGEKRGWSEKPLSREPNAKRPDMQSGNCCESTRPATTFSALIKGLEERLELAAIKMQNGIMKDWTANAPGNECEEWSSKSGWKCRDHESSRAAWIASDELARSNSTDRDGWNADRHPCVERCGIAERMRDVETVDSTWVDMRSASGTAP